MKFPSVYLLQAAARVLELVGVSSQSRTALRNSYHTTASGGEFPARQLVMAEDWLMAIGWLVTEGQRLRIDPGRKHVLSNPNELVRTLVQAIMLDGRPSWLATVHTPRGPRFDFIPVDAMQVLEELYERPDREALLLAAARKFDEASLVDLGALGESTVLAEWSGALSLHGRSDLLGQLRHVSLVSDALGYDIVAPRLDGSEIQLEVKCYRGRIPRCFITRNEFEIGRRLPSWYLVVCQAVTLTEATVVGWSSGERLKDRVPMDSDDFGQWQTARITFRAGELTSGLPFEQLP